MFSFIRQKKAVSASSYGLVLGLIAISTIASISLVSDNLKDLFDNAKDTLFADDTPDDFSFTARTEAWPNALQISDEITVTGINEAVIARTSAGHFIHNGLETESTEIIVIAGDKIALRAPAPPITLIPDDIETILIAVDIGDTSGSWEISNRISKNLFTPVTQADPNTQITSETVTLTGFDAPLTFQPSVAPESGAPIFYLNGTPIETETTVSPNDTLAIELTSGPDDGTHIEAEFLLGGIHSFWPVTSKDVEPQLSFNTVPIAPLNETILSEIVTPIAFDSPTSIQISSDNGSATYSLNSGSFTDQQGTLTPSETIQLSFQTGDVENLTSTIQLLVGSTEIRWTVTTADITPVLENVNLVNVAPNTPILSPSFTPTGFNYETEISISGDHNPEFELNGSGVWLTNGVIKPGDSVKLRQISGPPTGLDPSIATLTVGKTSQEWQVLANNYLPDPIIIEPTTGHLAGEYAISKPTFVTGINGLTEVRAPDANVQISVNNGDWTNYASIDTERSFRVRQFIPEAATPGQKFTATVIVGQIHGSEGETGIWSAEVAGDDKVPDIFAFTDIHGTDPGTETFSEVISLSGFDAQTELRVTGPNTPLVSVDAANFIDASSGIPVRPGQSVQVSLISSDYGQTTYADIEVGDFVQSDTVKTKWQITTRPIDKAPEANYQIPNIVVKQEYKATATSQSVTPTGFSDPIEIVISGADKDHTKAKLGSNGWVRPNASGSVGILNPGQSYQLQQYIDLADGEPKTVTVKVGDASPYTWSVETWDMYPAALTSPPTQNWTPAAGAWVRDSSGSTWYDIIEDVDDGILIPSSIDVIRNGQHVYPGGVVLGERIQDWNTAPYEANASKTVTYDIGGRKIQYVITSSNCAINPRVDIFPTVETAVPDENDYSISKRIKPTKYGAPMAVDLTTHASCNGGTLDPSAELRVYDSYSATTATQTGSSVVLNEGNYIELRVKQENVASKCVAIRFNGPKDGCEHLSGVTRFWYSNSSEAEGKAPDSLSVGNRTSTYNVNQIPVTVGISGGKRPMDIWITQKSGPTDASYNLQPINDYSSHKKYTLSYSQSIRTNHTGSRTPGAVYVYEICAGDYNVASDKTCTDWTVTISNQDVIPDALNLPSSKVNVAGNQYITSGKFYPSGFDGPISASVSGDSSAQISISGGAWTTSGRLDPNKSLEVRLMAGATDGIKKTASVSITGGGTTLTENWSITTIDDTPSDFNFADLSNVEPDIWVSSQNKTISGLGGPTFFRVTGDGNPRLEINNTGARLASGEIQDGDQVKLWNFLDQGYDRSHNVTFTLGTAITKDWSVRTRAQDSIPDAFSWPSSNNAVAGTSIQSTGLEPTGFLDSADVVILDKNGTDLEVSLNGRPYQSATNAGSVIPGQPIKLKLTAPPAGESRIVQLSVGGVIGSWTVNSAP